MLKKRLPKADDIDRMWGLAGSGQVPTAQKGDFTHVKALRSKRDSTEWSVGYGS